MKKVIFLFIIICIGENLCAQVDLRVREMKISNFAVDFNSEYIDEEYGDGPYLHFNCLMKNVTSDTVFINPSSSYFNIVFEFRGKVYKEELNVWQWEHKRNLLALKSDEILNFYAGSNIFLGTNILKENKGNYTLELLEILPTLKIIYIDKLSNMEIVLSGIEHVVLISPE